jgi:hypothetical protein
VSPDVPYVQYVQGVQYDSFADILGRKSVSRYVKIADLHIDL